MGVEVAVVVEEDLSEVDVVRKEEEIRKKGKSIIGIFSRIFASLPASSSES